MISGRPRDADLSRIIDVDLRPVVLPESGLAISDMLAQILGVRVGDFVEVDLLEGQRRTVSLPIAARVEDYFGIRGMMDAEALSRLMREAPAVNSVNLSLDANKLDLLYDAIKRMPTVSGMALQRVSLANFRETVGVACHHDGEHLHRACRNHRIRRRLQQRANFAFGARPGIGQPARPRLHPRRSVAHPSPRTRSPRR